MSEQQLREELDAVYRSTSWRITAPLRFIFAGLKSFKSLLISPRKSMIHILRSLSRYAWLVSAGKSVLHYFPSLRKRIRTYALSPAPQNANSHENQIEIIVKPQRADNMSDISTQILSELQAALRDKK